MDRAAGQTVRLRVLHHLKEETEQCPGRCLLLRERSGRRCDAGRERLDRGAERAEQGAERLLQVAHSRLDDGGQGRDRRGWCGWSIVERWRRHVDVERWRLHHGGECLLLLLLLLLLHG